MAPVKGALRNPQVHAWPGFLFNRKETLIIECPVALTYPHLVQPSPPVVAGVLARLHALSSSPRFSAPGAPHWGEGKAVPSYLACQGRAAGTALAYSLAR